jgi:hypothetical protein
MFSVRANMPPAVPQFIQPDMGTTCMGGYVSEHPLNAVVSQVTDSEGDDINIELRIFLASEDTTTATPVFHQTRAQTGMESEFDISGVPIPKDLQHRMQVRSFDKYGPSAWNDCVFTFGKAPPMDAGTGDMDAGTGGGGEVSTKGGCHCGSAEGLLAIAALALFRRRRAR